jgi:hypothetical protein
MTLSVLRLYSINDRISIECGAADGMRTDKKNRSTQRKPIPVPLCMSEIPHDLTWVCIQADVVRSKQYQ